MATGAKTTSVVLSNTYRDSVVLMRLGRQMEDWQGVEQATAMMGTPNNLMLLDQAGLLPEGGESIGPNDLVLAFRVSELAVLQDVAVRGRGLLTAEAGAVAAEEEYRPSTIEGALKTLPAANLAVVSVPGQYAAYEAGAALSRGLNVFVFSDNVSLEEEIELKRRALALDLFMLGPDCGTALIGGVPLGFANVVPQGNIGLAAASGTGLQQVTCLIARGGGGVSHALGVGGRDLDDRVRGMMMLKGLEALERDPATEVVVLISKPPGPATLERIMGALRCFAKPCVVCFLGAEGLTPPGASVFVEASLDGAASRALTLAGIASGDQGMDVGPSREHVERLKTRVGEGGRFIRGMFSGGTLCYEALLELRNKARPVHSNLELTGVLPSKQGESLEGHVLLDLGHDEFTAGRPHPIIDLQPRCRMIAEAADDPNAGVLLLDVVLGHGAHPDPASELGPAIVEARRAASDRGRSLACVVVLVGTSGDPQGVDTQRAKLEAAGALVTASNVRAATIAAELCGGAAEGRPSGDENVRR